MVGNLRKSLGRFPNPGPRQKSHAFGSEKSWQVHDSHINSISFNKQLLDEVEHDILNYQNRGLCYLTKPKAEADNTDTRF